MPLRPGETDPNQLYNAVGRAIHAWESMEEEFARLYARMAGLPEDPSALADYGAENRIFSHRMQALQDAAKAYFASSPDAKREGDLAALLEKAKGLSIKRHRIAHGHITQWGEFKIPDNLKSGEHFTMSSTLLYRWGAPWYSMLTLRTDPVGGDAASIEVAQKEFESLWQEIIKFTSELPKQVS